MDFHYHPWISFHYKSMSPLSFLDQIVIENIWKKIPITSPWKRVVSLLFNLCHIRFFSLVCWNWPSWKMMDGRREGCTDGQKFFEPQVINRPQRFWLRWAKKAGKPSCDIMTDRRKDSSSLNLLERDKFHFF